MDHGVIYSIYAMRVYDARRNANCGAGRINTDYRRTTSK